MKILNKILIFIKNIFNKKEEVKKLAEPEINVEQEKKVNFVNSLKVNIVENKKKNKIETLVCVGDGLGIQKKMTS